jgi:hypothetical protein
MPMTKLKMVALRLNELIALFPSNYPITNIGRHYAILVASTNINQAVNIHAKTHKP